MTRELKVLEHLSKCADRFALRLGSDWKLGNKIRESFWSLFDFVSAACRIRAGVAYFFFHLDRQNGSARSGTATITLLHLSVPSFFPKELRKAREAA